MATIVRRHDRSGKPRPYWSYVILCADGKRREYRGHPSKADTAREAAEREAKERAIANGQAARPIGYQEAVEAYLALGAAQGGRGGDPWAPKHLQQCRRNLRYWGEVLHLDQLSDLSLLDLEVHVHSMQAAPKTIRNRVEPLRALCLWAVRRQLLDRNPLAAWTAPRADPERPPRPLTPDEVRNLLDVATPDARLQYLTALWTGFRASELQALLPGDLDGRYLRLARRSTKSKLRNIRQPIPVWLADALHVQAKRLPLDAPLLQIPRGGAGRRQIQRDCDRAGIVHETEEGIASWHSLRKSYATLIVQHVNDPATLKDLVRHEDLRLTLDRYATTTEERRCGAIDAAARAWSCGAGMDQPKEKPAEPEAKRVHELEAVGIEPRPRPTTTGQPIATNRLIGREIDIHSGPIYQVNPTENHDPCGAGVDQLDPCRELYQAADRYAEVLRLLRGQVSCRGGSDQENGAPPAQQGGRGRA